MDFLAIFVQSFKFPMQIETIYISEFNGNRFENKIWWEIGSFPFQKSQNTFGQINKWTLRANNKFRIDLIHSIRISVMIDYFYFIFIQFK